MLLTTKFNKTLLDATRIAFADSGVCSCPKFLPGGKMISASLSEADGFAQASPEDDWWSVHSCAMLLKT
jgi:hypothetical protein